MIPTSRRRSLRCRPATSGSTPRSRRSLPRRRHSPCPLARDHPKKRGRISRSLGSLPANQTKKGTQMTNATDIDRNAPVIAHHEIDIVAPLETVWNLHTDVDAWPAWNLEVTAAKLDGAFAPGNSFTWTSYDFTVTSTIYIVEDLSRTLWGGQAQGIMGTHEWRFAQSPAGVRVITIESFAGEAVDADPTGMQTILDNSLAAWLTRLKQKAESSAHDS